MWVISFIAHHDYCTLVCSDMINYHDTPEIQVMLSVLKLQHAFHHCATMLTLMPHETLSSEFYTA